MYHIDIITPPRLGGPFNWAQNLSRDLNGKQFHARHLYLYSDILKSQFTSSADLIHAAFPYPVRPGHKPYILTIKGDFTIENPLIVPLYHAAIYAADIITVPSLYLKNKLGLVDAIIIPNSVRQTKNFYHPSSRKNLNLLTVTNLWFPQKAAGVKTLINIINRLGNINLTLTVLGNGRFKQELVEFSQKHAKFTVNFPGWQNPQHFYGDTDIFLYYSYHDNMPNSLLEAQAAGLPIISNSVGAVDEIILDHSGLIARNQNQFQNQLQLLINSRSLRLKLSQLALTTSRKYFSSKETVKKYRNLYRQLL